MSSEVTAAEAAYQGRPGAYSEAAARRLCGGDAVCLPCDTLREVFDAVAAGRARMAVVPVENSLAGAVPGALGLILSSDLVVHGETAEAIDHVLVAPRGTTFDDLREVLSHPVALAQCEGFFRRHRQLTPVPVFDTAGALELIVNDGDPSRAAIASRAAAARHPSVILAEGIQDHRENYTRFFLLGRPPPARPAHGPCRLVLAVRLEHRPGALAELLQSVASWRVNLTRIDSWPVKGRPFEYEFLLEGLVDVAAVDQLVQNLSAVAWVRLLGCSPRAGGPGAMAS